MAHAPEQEIKRGLLAIATHLAVFIRVKIVLQSLGKLLRILIAQGRITCQGLVQNTAQTLVDRNMHREANIFIGDAMHHLKNIVPADRPLPNEHFIKNETRCKDIGAFAKNTLLDILRGHIGRRPGILIFAFAALTR